MTEIEASEVVLVTGGSGFLGQHIVKMLQERDPRTKEIRVLDLLPYAKKLDYEDRKPMKSYVGDIRKKEAIREAFKGVDCVIHSAAMMDYRFPADHDALNEVNVIGTQNVVELCREENVPVLVQTSSSQVAFRQFVKHFNMSICLYETEHKFPRADNPGDLIVGGPVPSKCRAEQIVLAADKTKLANGCGELRTIALEPTLLYGEEDKSFFPTLLQVGQLCGGRLLNFMGSRGKQQITYAGNAAWAHICAKNALREKPDTISGLPVLINDDTLATHLLDFTKPFADAHGCTVSKWPIWVPLVFIIMWILQLVFQIVSPMFKVYLPMAPCDFLSYSGSILVYNRTRACIYLDYEPIVTEEEAVKRSIKYYQTMKIAKWKKMR